MFALLKERDYRLLWSGQGISHLGDQFHAIALPWLVLALTRDPLQVGLVLALAGIPRAALMLFGGVFADRMSPRTIMLVSDVLRLVITAGVAAAVLSGQVAMWMVYVLALAFGVVSGFFMPAAEAALPRLVGKDRLEGGNALMMGIDQIASFLGPAAAGAVIAAFGVARVGHGAALTGIGIAFVVDAVSFAVSAATLLAMRPLPSLHGGEHAHPLAALVEGLRFYASRPTLRWMFGLIAVANLLVAGPLMVGVPVLAQTRFAEGAVAFGFIMAAYAGGNLFGMVGAGTAPRPSSKAFTFVVVALFAGFGLVVGALGFITSMWVAVAMMALLGLGNGYIAVIAMSTLQRMTPEDMLGRVMSLMVLAMLGLMPLSQTIAGAAIKLGPAAMFGTAGAGFILVAITAAVRHASWSLDRMERDALETAPQPA